MKHILYPCLCALIAVLSLSSCHHDEPGNPIKPIDKRTVLLITSEGKIYDQTGEMVMQLPNCTFASEIIADGNDYFVAGVQSKGRVGYWKNGKWNTLHVDFIDDVDHWTYGIGKWDYYIYLLDIPNVLKNSGIFPLEDANGFMPADHALRVSEGKCFVIGYQIGDDPEAYYKPVLYTNYKKEILPMPDGAESGECHAIYAYDRDHTIIGGIIDRKPAVWVDKKYYICECSYPWIEPEGGFMYGRIESITFNKGHVYAAGFEIQEDGRLIATLWTDGIPTHYVYDEENADNSQAKEIYTYGDDVYLLTSEYSRKTEQYSNHLWVNGIHVRTYPNVEATGLTVL
ncbi:MAG: hypothetical protein IJ775_04610 [Muribaculaceae bacterium]|nr:hypothetical protein [Muribaculaceae bacterium]